MTEATATTSSSPKQPAASTGAAAVEFEPPLACVRRILKNSLPSSTNVGKDASSAFARACGIFVIYITACANDFARENRRQTITANDVLAAVKELDFDEFTPQLTVFLEQYRAREKSKKVAKQRAKEGQANGDTSKAIDTDPTATTEQEGDEEQDPDDEDARVTDTPSPRATKRQRLDSASDDEDQSEAASTTGTSPDTNPRMTHEDMMEDDDEEDAENVDEDDDQEEDEEEDTGSAAEEVNAELEDDEEEEIQIDKEE